MVVIVIVVVVEKSRRNDDEKYVEKMVGVTLLKMVEMSPK